MNLVKIKEIELSENKSFASLTYKKS